MIRLLRHDDTVHREDDGAVRFDDQAEMFKSRFAGPSQWSIEAWTTTFLVFPNNPGTFWRYFVDPTLQDNVLLPDDFAEYIYHIGNAPAMHPVIQGGLIPGGESLKRDRQSVFLTAVNPMYANQHLEEDQYDLDKFRIAV